MIQDDIKNLVVLDSIRESLEILDSDIMPQSESHPLVSGIENVPSQLYQAQYNGQWAATFTTFPLSPLEGRVHYIKDSFLHVNFNINFQIYVAQALENDLYMYVGPRDVSSIFNQLMLLMDNNTIWNTSFHHIESAIAMASFPASLVDHSPDYATIDKLLNQKETPMKLITIESGTSAGTLVPFSLNYDLTIDLNRLCVPLSNLEYITSNMGNLRLKVFLNNIADSFYFFVLPSSIGPINTNDTSSEIIQSFNTSGLLCLNPILWSTSTSSPSTLVDIPMSDNLTYTIGGGDEGPSPNTIKIAFIGINSVSSGNFIAFEAADICQTCFDLEEQGWQKLCEYFSSMGKVILPAQQFTTNSFTNGSGSFSSVSDSSSNAAQLFNTPLIGFAGGNNITDIIITYPCTQHQTCLCNPYITQCQCLLDGKPINAVPYQKIRGRAIKDFTNACIDTDKDEINTDYLYSLNFPPYIATTGSTESSTSYFFDNMLSLYNNFKSSNGAVGNFIKNPNLYMLVFETGIPDSFHTGACISEFSNRQAMIRLTGSYATLYNTFSNLSAGMTDYSDETLNDNFYQWFPTPANIHCDSYLSVLCDICIVLDYDANYNTCTSGYISYAKPYLSEGGASA